MNSEQIRAYRQATADRAAAEQGRTVHDQEMIASHDRAVRSGLRVLRDIDHEQALIDNLPCELCGRIEQHANHRGIGHTHTPAEDPKGRAHALLGRMGGDPNMVIPDYVYETARMMVGRDNDLPTVVGYDHDAALVEEGSPLPVVSPWVPVRELGHPAHPHLLRPTECMHCGRAIFVRYDAHGGFESASHYA